MRTRFNSSVKSKTLVDPHSSTPTRRNFLSAVGVGALALAEPSWASAAERTLLTPPRRDRTYSFAVVADPQLYGVYHGRTITQYGKEHEHVLFERVIQRVNEINPAFVMVVGDMVQHQCVDRSEIDNYQQIVGKLRGGVPVHVVPGNHDTDGSPRSLRRYRRVFGDDRYAFEHGDCVHIAVNSMLLRTSTAGGRECAEQLGWLEKQLKRARSAGAAHIFIYQHHPMFRSGPLDRERHYAVPPRIRPRIMALYEKYGVSAVFAGHLHREAYAKHANIEYITTSAACMPLGPDGPGFRVVTVHPDHIEHRYFSTSPSR